MKAIGFKDLAQKNVCSKEEARAIFEKEVTLVKLCIMSPDRSEAICFDPQEIQDLIDELSSGKIALTNLAEQLKLTSYQIHYVVEHLQKTEQIKGELTYNTFTSNSAAKLLLLQKTSRHKREHRQKMRKKRK